MTNILYHSFCSWYRLCIIRLAFSYAYSVDILIAGGACAIGGCSDSGSAGGAGLIIVFTIRGNSSEFILIAVLFVADVGGVGYITYGKVYIFINNLWKSCIIGSYYCPICQLCIGRTPRSTNSMKDRFRISQAGIL